MRSSRTIRFVMVLLAMLTEISGYGNSQQTYLDCLVSFEPYAETNWHLATYSNAPVDAGYFGDGASGGNEGIRASCGVALAYAVLVQAFPNATNRAARLTKIRQTLNYAANTHTTGSNVCADGLKWGHTWQSGFFAGHVGIGCMVALTNLPASCIQAVQRVITDEANYLSGILPPSGYVSDTKAEENGWNTHVPALASAWLTSNTYAPLWLDTAKEYFVNTLTVPNTAGDPLASWVTTETLYPDFALENHGFYHPGYQAAAGGLMGDSFLMAWLANTNIARQLEPFAEHNQLNEWTLFSHHLLDSGEMAFPASEDWCLNDYEQNSYVAWMAAHFNDPMARWADGQVAQLARYRQLVNGNGQFVGPSGGGFYREAIQAYRSGMAWLEWANAQYPTGPSTPPGPALVHLPDVGVIEQRGSNGYFSICYGPQTNGSAARIMAIIEAPAAGFPSNVYTVTPRLPGVLGLGAMGAPTRARLVSLTTNGNAFTAELQLTNGANGTTEVYVNCTGESIGMIEIPHPNPGFANSAAASFTVGIENAPLNGGSRLVQWNSGSVVMTNFSGVARNVTNNWICLAGHYGMACGPAGYFRYQTATGYTHADSGTAEDTLQFFPTNSLTPRYAVWFPGKNATATLSNASQVIWQMDGSNFFLQFPGAGGATAQIVISAPPLTIFAQPQSVAISNGQPANFSVGAVSGTGESIAYLWQKNGTNIPGATYSTLNIPSAGALDVASYQCIVSVPTTNITSAAAQLHLLPGLALPSVASGALFLCLRADAGIVTNSYGVTTWFDNSTNSFRFDAQADYTNTFPPRMGTGLTGNRVVSFTGSNYFACSVPVRLFTASNSPLTIFAAFSTRDNSVQRYLFNSKVPRVGRQFTEMMMGTAAGNRNTPGSFGIHRAAGGASVSDANIIDNNQFAVMAVTVLSNGAAPANIQMRCNGADVEVSGFSPTSPTAPYTEPGWLSAGHYPTNSYPFYIGVAADSGSTSFLGLGYWLGDIAEIIIYRGVLSDTDRMAVEAYLGRKYGLFDGQLAISRHSGEVTVSYPLLAGAYVLESTTNLLAPASWMPVNPLPAIVEGQYIFTNTAGSQTYYRLRLP